MEQLGSQKHEHEITLRSSHALLLFYESYPIEPKRRWDVYVLVIKEKDAQPNVYASSSIYAKYDDFVRLSHNDKKVFKPIQIAEALEKGYIVENKGL